MRLKSRRGFLKGSAIAAGSALTVGNWGRALAGEGSSGESPAPPSARFLDAVAADDQAAVTRWLAEDPGLLHVKDGQGRSAFAIALLAHHREMGQLLEARGHRTDLHEAALALDWERFGALAEQAPGLVNQDHPVGGTAMYAAAAGGAGKDIWRIYSHTGDPNAMPRDEGGTSPLRIALDYPDLPTAEMTAATLISNGADPNLPLAGGDSPLHAAARRGSTELVEMIVRKGGDVTATDLRGRTAQELAASSGQRATAELLGRHAEIPRDHSTSRTAYDADGAPYRAPDLSSFSLQERSRVVGASHGALDVVRQAVDRHPELAHSVATTTEIAIEACAHTGRTPIVDYLVDQGAPYSLPTAVMRNDLPRVRALLDEDPLRIHERAAHDFALLWYAVIGGGWTELAELLLDRGAEIERQHWMGTTALHWAAFGGQTDMAALFIEHGADVHRVGRKFDAAGQTPLELALSRDRTETVNLLRERGAHG